MRSNIQLKENARKRRYPHKGVARRKCSQNMNFKSIYCYKIYQYFLKKQQRFIQERVINPTETYFQIYCLGIIHLARTQNFSKD